MAPGWPVLIQNPKDGVIGCYPLAVRLQDDGSLEIELSFDNGDDAILTAQREMTSSTAC
jgi:hypothetical protein